jgi:hypothetical protein
VFVVKVQLIHLSDLAVSRLDVIADELLRPVQHCNLLRPFAFIQPCLELANRLLKMRPIFVRRSMARVRRDRRAVKVQGSLNPRPGLFWPVATDEKIYALRLARCMLHV